MALYLGGAKIAGAGGGGNANIVSCSSYEDYMARRPHDPKTVYVTPDNGGSGGGSGVLSDYAVLSGGNDISGYNLISSVCVYDTFSTDVISKYSSGGSPITVATCHLGKASTVPSPDSDDNSDAIATTQFVKAVAGNNKIVLVDTAPTDADKLEQNIIYATHEPAGTDDIVKLTNLYMKTSSQFIKLMAGGTKTAMLKYSGKYRVKLIGCSGYSIDSFSAYLGTREISQFFGSGAYFDGFVKLDAGLVELNCPVYELKEKDSYNPSAPSGGSPHYWCSSGASGYDRSKPFCHACIRQNDKIIYATNAVAAGATLWPGTWTLDYIPILSGNGTANQEAYINWTNYHSNFYRIDIGQLSNYVSTNPLTEQLGIDNGKNMTPSTYGDVEDLPYKSTFSGVPGYVYLEYVGPWT